MTTGARTIVSIAVVATTLYSLGCGSKSAAPPTPTPQAPTLTSVTVSPNSIASGSAATGTVQLSAAPTSATTVGLSSNNAAATVPGNVTVNSGSASSTFNIATTEVTQATAVTITASLSGVNQTATLTLNIPPLTGTFKVRARSDVKRKLNTDPSPVTILPAGTEDACPLVNAQFDCEFDGTGSTPSASIREYVWTYFVGPRQRIETSTTPKYKPSEQSCNFFGNLQSTNTGGVQFIGMRVDLQVRDTSGNLSPVVSNQNVRIFPAGQCGYGF